MTRWQCLVLVWMGCGVSAGSSAQPPESDARILESLELRRTGHVDEAIQILEDVVADDPNGRNRAQLGFALQEAGRWVSAYEHLQAALDTTHPWVSEYRQIIEESLNTARENLGLVMIESNVVGAEVLVGDSLVGQLPLAQPIPVAPGPIRLTVRHSSYRSAIVRLDVTPGASIAETVELLPEQPEDSSPNTDPDPESVVNVRAETPERLGLPTETGRARRFAAVTVGGVGLALTGTSLLLLHSAHQNLDEYNGDDCLNDGTRYGCATQRSRAERQRRASIALLATGGGALVTALGLLLREIRSRPDAEDETAFHCVLGELGLNVACQARF